MHAHNTNTQGYDQGCDLWAEHSSNLLFDLLIWAYTKKYEIMLSLFHHSSLCSNFEGEGLDLKKKKKKDLICKVADNIS